MKRKISTRLLLVLAACFTCVLALGTTLARAQEGDPATTPAAGTGTLTVTASNADTETDVMKAGAKFYVYRIASADKDQKYDTYNYTFINAFEGLNENYKASDMDKDAWDAKTKAAEDIVANGNVDTYVDPKDLGETITVMDDGLYLVVVPESASPTTIYTFTSAIVAVPNVPGKSITDDNGNTSTVYNTSQGNWTKNVTAVVKWTSRPRYGKLKIYKNVDGFSGETATFTYTIQGTIEGTDGPRTISYDASIDCNSEDTYSTTIESIPSGIEFTVNEYYEGARYQIDNPDNKSQKVTIKPYVESDPDSVTSVSFTNIPLVRGDNEPDDIVSGHGIENHFMYNEETGNWDLTARVIDASEIADDTHYEIRQ